MMKENRFETYGDLMDEIIEIAFFDDAIKIINTLDYLNQKMEKLEAENYALKETLRNQA